jgi:PAS domain S-box-containing protein
LILRSIINISFLGGIVWWNARYLNATDQNALQQSEEGYRSLLQATIKVLQTTDTIWKFTTVKESWEAITGETFTEYQGLNWQYSLDPDHRERTIQVWLQGITKNCLYENEYRIFDSNGEYHCFWVRALPVLKTDGSSCPLKGGSLYKYYCSQTN